MNTGITVVSADSKRFLEKMMKFGVDNELITAERREAFVKAGVNLYPQICAKLLSNGYNIGDAVEAGEVALNLISIALERESQGDMARACAYFSAKSDFELIQEIIKLIDSALDRLETLFSKATKPVQVKFDYFVMIYKVSDEYMIFKSRASAVRRNINDASVYRSLTNALKLEDFLKTLEEMEYEYYVSSTFLPWDLLKEHAGVRDALATREGRDSIDGWTTQYRTFQTDWDSEKLLASMTVLWVCGGSYLRVCTVVPRSVLDHIKQTLRSPKRFRERSEEQWEKYLNSVLSQEKNFDAKARAYLTKMWEKAMDKLLLGVPKQLSQFDYITWSLRLITDIPGAFLHGYADHVISDATGKRYRPPSIKKQKLIEKLKDPDKELTLGRARKILRCVRWQTVGNDELREVIALVPSDAIIDNISITVKTAEIVTEFWGKWSAEDKKKFIRRVLTADSADAKFWEHLEDVVFDRLQSAADSMQKSDLLHERRKYFLVEGK